MYKRQVLHRPSSQVIHCTVLYSTINIQPTLWPLRVNLFSARHFPHGERAKKPSGEAKIFERLVISWNAVVGAPYLPVTGPPADGAPLQQTPPAHSVERWQSDWTAARRSETRWNQFQAQEELLTNNDPSAGSPTETLLRLLLPLNAQVWESFQHNGSVNSQSADPNTSLKRSIGSSDGRCVQRAGT